MTDILGTLIAFMHERIHVASKLLLLQILVTSISTMLLACVCHYESTRTVISLLLS
jgi:hypothetical protein